MDAKAFKRQVAKDKREKAKIAETKLLVLKLDKELRERQRPLSERLIAQKNI